MSSSLFLFYRNSYVFKKNKKSICSIGIFYINLDRSSDRRAIIEPLCDQLSKILQNYNCVVQRIEAIDGQLISMESVESYVDLKSFKNYRGRLPRLGEIACSLSHLHALQAFINQHLDVALVLEDDAVFDPILLGQLITQSIDHAHKWDVLNLQNSHRSLPIPLQKLMSKYTIVQFFGHIGGAGAYLINRKAANNYINYFFPICLQYDHFYTRSWEFDILFRGIKPSPVRQVFEKSYINTSPVMQETQLDKKSILKKFMFSSSSAIRQVLRNILEHIRFVR